METRVIERGLGARRSDPGHQETHTQWLTPSSTLWSADTQIWMDFFFSFIRVPVLIGKHFQL